jgi:hypothetical protein
MNLCTSESEARKTWEEVWCFQFVHVRDRSGSRLVAAGHETYTAATFDLFNVCGVCGPLTLSLFSTLLHTVAGLESASKVPQ